MIRRRADRHDLHGHQHIRKQRLLALLMISTGLMRVCIWATLMLLYLVHVPAIRHLYAEVSFVTVLSVLALLLTDWGQVAASLAQLTAGDAHHDAEHNRRMLETNGEKP